MTATNENMFTRSTEVEKLIKAANNAAGNMLTKSQLAGKTAAKEALKLTGDITSDDIAPMADAIVKLYDDQFTPGTPVRQNFKDALLLSLAADLIQIEVNAKTNDGQTVKVTKDAGDMVDSTKHAMREAAAKVRDVLGIAKKGSGRKSKKEAEAQTTANNEELALAAFLHNIKVYMLADTSRPRVIAALKDAGYKITPIKTK